MPETILENPKHERQDLAMVQMALRNDWPISDEMRKLAVEQCVAILQNPKARARSKTAAARTLATFFKLNMDVTELLREKAPQVVVVNNNTNSVDTLSELAGKCTPEQAQQFLELMAQIEQNTSTAEQAKPAGN